MTGARSPLQAVTFDFWNTLLRADNPGVRERRVRGWQELVSAAGHEVTTEVVEAAVSQARVRFDERWERGIAYSPTEAAADALASFGVPADPALVADLAAVLTDPDPAYRDSLTPNIGDALEALRSAGVKIGIICDVGLAPSSTLRQYLETQGILGYFDHWSFSDEVGTFKPDPRIFTHALSGLGATDPARCAHIGDLRRTDIAGARAHGMVAVRYRGAFDDPGSAAHGTLDVEGHHVLDDHADLFAALHP